MARIPSYLLLSVIVAGLAVPLSAQTSQEPPSSHVKVIPPPLDVEDATGRRVKDLPAPSTVPFALDSPKDGSMRRIGIVPADHMTREDRDLLANAESSIHERAAIQNFDFDDAGWTHDQVVCPALPKHLFIRFTRDDGTRQMSTFSASIPRDGNGSVHIIPIVRKGYSLFAPAPIGALTIAAFNRIRTEEGAGASADWLGTGLCYAALAGANPQVGQLSAEGRNDITETMLPSLTITTDGGAIIRFADIAATPKPMEWSMNFAPSGKLVKAEHSVAYVERIEKKTVGATEAKQ